MGLRDYMNNNSSVVTIVAVVVLVIALGIIVMTSKGPGGGSYIKPIYFYDLNTGKIFTAESDQRAPIPTESGPTTSGKNAGVQAYVGTCGECQDYTGMTNEELEAAGAFITRLEMYTPEALAQMEAAASGQVPDMGFDPMNMVIVKRPTDTQWVPSESMQGMQMMMGDDGTRCPGSVMKMCQPM